jgi:hypothetical protein
MTTSTACATKIPIGTTSTMSKDTADELFRWYREVLKLTAKYRSCQDTENNDRFIEIIDDLIAMYSDGLEKVSARHTDVPMIFLAEISARITCTLETIARHKYEFPQSFIDELNSQNATVCGRYFCKINGTIVSAKDIVDYSLEFSNGNVIYAARGLVLPTHFLRKE